VGGWNIKNKQYTIARQIRGKSIKEEIEKKKKLMIKISNKYFKKIHVNCRGIFLIEQKLQLKIRTPHSFYGKIKEICL